MRSLLIGKKKSWGGGEEEKEKKKKEEKIKHALNSIKTAIMALVVRPEDSFV